MAIAMQFEYAGVVLVSQPIILWVYAYSASPLFAMIASGGPLAADSSFCAAALTSLLFALSQGCG